MTAAGQAHAAGPAAAVAGLPDGARLALRAGNPTREEVAAVVVALHAAATVRPGAPTSGRPSWQLAARLEGVGRLPAASPADLWAGPGISRPGRVGMPGSGPWVS